MVGLKVHAFKLCQCGQFREVGLRQALTEVSGSKAAKNVNIGERLVRSTAVECTHSTDTLHVLFTLHSEDQIDSNRTVGLN